MFRRNFIRSLVTLTLGLETSAIAHAADLTAAERPKQTFDAVLMAEFRRDPTAYVDLATGAFTMTGKVVFDPHALAVEEWPNLKILTETGQWVAPSGRHYDLRQAQMYFRDGTGGLGDLLANLATQPRRGWRPSVGVESAVAYREGMTANDFLEETIRGLGVDRYHLDGASGAIVVPVLHLSLRDLPEAFAAKVIALVTTGIPWTAASGATYDLSRATITYSVWAQASPRNAKKRLHDELYAIVKDASPEVERTAFVSTMNATAENALSPAILERMRKVINMKPLTVCRDALAEPGTPD